MVVDSIQCLAEKFSWENDACVIVNFYTLHPEMDADVVENAVSE